MKRPDALKALIWNDFDQIRFQTDGLDSYVGKPEIMSIPHRHNEIEFNFLDSGSMTSIIGGEKIHLKAGFLGVFWAGIPHQVTQVQDGTKNRWLTIPLKLCAQWKLPPSFLKKIFFSSFVCESNPSYGAHDQAHLASWHQDLKEGSEERKEIALLEIQARLLRLALNQENITEMEPIKQRDGLFDAGSMMFFIAQNYQKSIRIQDVARSTNLNPNNAMKLFRKTFDLSIMDHVTQLRLVHAKSLLKNSKLKILEVALESGFNSLSSFYEIFEKNSGHSPGHYRNSLADPIKESKL